MKKTQRYTLAELAEASGVTARSIRHYISKDVLPPPEGLGRYARYHQHHLERLGEIKVLREHGLTLDEIASGEWYVYNPGGDFSAVEIHRLQLDYGGPPSAEELSFSPPPVSMAPAGEGDDDEYADDDQRSTCGAPGRTSSSLPEAERVRVLRVNERITVLMSEDLPRGEREALEAALEGFLKGQGK